MKININLSYEAAFEVENVSLDLDQEYDGDNFMKYSFYVSMSYGNKQKNMTVSQSVCFVDMEPPAEDIFPGKGVSRWEFTYYEEGERIVKDFVELEDIEKKILESALEQVFNEKEKFKEAYIKFWNEYIRNEKESALRELRQAEKLQQKLDSFLETIKDI